jgi:two-component system, LytTR family, response regulator
MIRSIAIDDSPLALDLIEDYVGRMNGIELAQRCTSALEAIPLIKKGGIDLLFLDIEMPDISGIQLVRSLDIKPKIIFTTAYSNYALEGFNVNATDYLLKPFSFDRFKKAVEKVQHQLELEHIAIKENEHLFIRSGYETLRVTVRDIRYIEALKDYIQIHTGDKKIVALMSMKEISALLPKDQFIRVHRSFIISQNHLSGYTSKKIMIGNKEIPLGESYKETFLDFVKHLR